MIDWEEPLETIPCENNPEPVDCVVTGRTTDGNYKVMILGDWFSGESNKKSLTRSDSWYYTKSTGSADVGFLPNLRNVEYSFDE